MQTGDTIRDQFDDYKSEFFPNGIIYINSYTDNDGSIAAGHQVVKELLSYDTTRPISHTNKPKLYVSDECANHVYAFLHYAHEDYRDIEKGVKEKVSDKFKDFMDILRYTAVEVVGTMPQTEAQKQLVEETKDIPESWQRFREPAAAGYGG